MATNAIAFAAGVCRWKFLGMAGQAFRPKVSDGFHRLAVRIMARTTPQPSIALACAGASCKLFYVADDFEFLSCGALGQHLSVRGENILKALAWPVVAELLSRIQHSAGAE
jgi:hypothetical protein